MYRRLACDVLASPTSVATAPADVQPRLDEGAVDHDKAEEKDCQCRNWPDHVAAIDPHTLERHPCNEGRGGTTAALSCGRSTCHRPRTCASRDRSGASSHTADGFSQVPTSPLAAWAEASR